jgi:hypothetical protein
LYYGLPEDLLASSVADNIVQFADWYSLLHQKSFVEADLTMLDERGQEYVTMINIFPDWSILLVLISPDFDKMAKKCAGDICWCLWF